VALVVWVEIETSAAGVEMPVRVVRNQTVDSVVPVAYHASDVAEVGASYSVGNGCVAAGEIGC